MLSSLDSDYLGRVKRTYRLAVSECTPAGPVWAPIDARRADIHAAMLAETDNDLRNIFSDPYRPTSITALTISVAPSGESISAMRKCANP